LSYAARVTDSVVDLYSDTATKPTPEMLQAMFKARLGDEQRRTDPTVNALEERVAQLLGKERAVLVPTATLANQIALMFHARAGDEVLCHRTAHVFNNEGGGVTANSGAQVFPLDGERGIFDADAVRAALRPDDPHQPNTRAVVVENTSNGGGGSLWPDDTFLGVAQVCKEQGLALHIDGARLFNAAVARGVTPAHWGKHATSVQVCFSKGLGCAFGAVLAVDAVHEREVRRIKQRMGGALRQAGIMAGAMLYALDHHVERLAEDHRRARTLADGLREYHELELDPVDTNLVYFRYSGSTRELAERLKAAGVLVSRVGADRVRLCTYLGITDEDVERTLKTFRQVLAR
jgi:threonine aldolase